MQLFFPVDFFRLSPHFFRHSPHFFRLSPHFFRLSPLFSQTLSTFFSDFLHRRFYRECMKVHPPNGKCNHLNFSGTFLFTQKKHWLHIECPSRPKMSSTNSNSLWATMGYPLKKSLQLLGLSYDSKTMVLRNHGFPKIHGIFIL
jgi:hypothetical protein